MKLSHWLSAAALLVFTSASFAANVTVTVLGSMQFTPTTVNINAGDTVTFKYAGGGLPHNVVADDNSFRCATSCSGNGGNATSAAWTAVVPFATAGTFRYYCELHGAPGGVGMSGTVIVHAATASINVGGYLSGNWYNPNQGGHGFQLEFTKDAGLLAIWFVYSPDGSAQNWIYAQGAYDTTKNTVTVPAVIFTGAKFPPNFNPADVHQQGGALWGNMTFTFTDCNHGSVSWHSDVAGYNNANDTPLALTRLTQIDGTSCPQ
jgi:plastocyanin